jgi:hypothetical protein
MNKAIERSTSKYSINIIHKRKNRYIPTAQKYLGHCVIYLPVIEKILTRYTQDLQNELQLYL